MTNARIRKKQRKNALLKDEQPAVLLRMHENITDAELDEIGIDHDEKWRDPRGKEGVLKLDFQSGHILFEFRSMIPEIEKEYVAELIIPKTWLKDATPKEYVGP